MSDPKFKISINLGVIAAYGLLAFLYRYVQQIGTPEAVLAYGFAWVWLITRKG